MNFKRKIRRRQLPKTPRCCGVSMIYKDSYGDWMCQKCGKIKHKPKGTNDEQK